MKAEIAAYKAVQASGKIKGNCVATRLQHLRKSISAIPSPGTKDAVPEPSAGRPDSVNAPDPERTVPAAEGGGE